eukprot:jgi/Tetstr1/422424/TSEL_013262.t1
MRGPERQESADLLSIGTRCAHPECRQLDFLPFECDCCSRTFCLEHRTYRSHSCPSARAAGDETIVCPLCARAIRVAADEDANLAWERHQREGCDTANYAKVHKKPRCPAPSCKEKLNSVNTYRCKDCGIEVCLKHRFPADHGCAERIAQARAARGAGGWAAKANSSLGRMWGSGTGTGGGSSASARPVSASRPTAPKPRRQPQPQPQPANNTLRGSAEQRMVNDRPEICQLCGARFASVQLLIQHSEEYHQQAPSRRGALETCPHCRQQFSDAVALVTHVERSHGAGRSPSVVTGLGDKVKRFFGY